VISVDLPELGPVQARLTPEQGRRLAASGVAAATPSPYEAGLWDIAATGKVGAARVGDVELWIRPKLPVDRLLFLIGYAKDPKGWRDETVRLDARSGLVAAVAQALWRQTERALSKGLLQGYRTVEEASTVLRGRLREAEQLRRHFGLAIPMEIRHDDFTTDIPENQILLAAITRILTVPRVDAESRRHLAELRIRLADVTSPVRGNRLPVWQPSRLNDRYRNALRLAEIVWRATTPEPAPGPVPSNGFLVSMPVVFEDFVTVALSEHLGTRHLGAGLPQYPCHLDEAAAVHMRPDLVWTYDGAAVAVVDAKYKRERPAGYPDADLYQMLAYCTALGLQRGHLVYAAGAAEPQRHVVRHAGIEIRCHALDLARTPQEVLAQVAAVGDQVLSRSLSV
jgi:5-methylcytosine-specific restriction enzyme subunit McrC